MQKNKLSYTCKIARFHFRPCGELVTFCKENNIEGNCIKNNKKARLDSITELFLLNIQYNDKIEFEISKDTKNLKQFLDKF